MFKFIFSYKTNITLMPLVVSRIVIGIFFVITGCNKLFNPVFQKSMLKTITGIGFPYPSFTANFTAASEAIFGLLLAIGLFTRFSSAALIVILLVALVTFDIPNYIPQGLDPFTWYSYFTYLPQTLYLLIIVNILVVGGGPLSLDKMIAARIDSKKDRPSA
ncbi:DoxX family protein [Sphingobacterium kitahiroshimense]|uniref:DoxX family protein n=1 Tax=Sphingobacterium kitahiroshimense TaxID=470446 RepID=A0ABV0C025_9SPHI